MHDQWIILASYLLYLDSNCMFLPWATDSSLVTRIKLLISAGISLVVALLQAHYARHPAWFTSLNCVDFFEGKNLWDLLFEHAIGVREKIAYDFAQILLTSLILRIFIVLIASVFEVLQQDCLEDIHENHLTDDNQGEKVHNSHSSVGFDEDKHVRVPVFTS